MRCSFSRWAGSTRCSRSASTSSGASRGLFNAGVGGFFAIGAYVSAILTSAASTRHLGGYDLPIPAGICAAMVASALVAWGIGRICIRLAQRLSRDCDPRHRGDSPARAQERDLGDQRGAGDLPDPETVRARIAEPWNQVGMLLLVFAIVLVLYVLLERARRSRRGGG